MIFTPVALVLIGFVASLVALTGAYAIHCGVARLAARKSE